MARRFPTIQALNVRIKRALATALDAGGAGVISLDEGADLMIEEGRSSDDIWLGYYVKAAQLLNLRDRDFGEVTEHLQPTRMYHAIAAPRALNGISRRGRLEPWERSHRTCTCGREELGEAMGSTYDTAGIILSLDCHHLGPHIAWDRARNDPDTQRPDSKGYWPRAGTFVRWRDKKRTQLYSHPRCTQVTVVWVQKDKGLRGLEDLARGTQPSTTSAGLPPSRSRSRRRRPSLGPTRRRSRNSPRPRVPSRRRAPLSSATTATEAPVVLSEASTGGAEESEARASASDGAALYARRAPGGA